VLAIFDDEVLESMQFFRVEDEYYYSKAGKEELARLYNVPVDSFVVAMDKKRIVDAFDDGSVAEKNFIAPFLPETLSSAYKGVFDVVRVPNKYGILTESQMRSGVDAKVVLKEKLGVIIHSPSVTFDDYILDRTGDKFDSILNSLRLIKTRKESGIGSKGFFLTGIPGTGKTFFAKCIAGELNRYLVELNLSIFINDEDTFGLLQKFFDFFKYSEGEYIILIDEIEKMFNQSEKAVQVLGYLLTTLNDFQDKSKGNKADVLFIATANNVTDLAQRNPELFRKGRFDLSIYLTAPNEEKAKATYDSYIGKVKKKFSKETLPFLMYKAYFDEGDKEYNILENSRAKRIVEKFRTSENFTKIKEQYKDDGSGYVQDKVKRFYDFCTGEDALLTAEIEDITKEFEFHLSSDEFVRKGYSCYRNQMETNRVDYPYVPAEIEAMVMQIYSTYYFEAEGEVDITQYCKSNTPLQISMSQGIKLMDGATRSFIKL